MLIAMLDFGLLLHASLPNSYLDPYCDEQHSIPTGRYRSKLSAAVMLIYRLPCWLFFAALVVAPIGEACALNDPSGAVSAHERSTDPIAHGLTLEFASLPAATAKDPDVQGGDEHWPDRLVQRSLSVSFARRKRLSHDGKHLWRIVRHRSCAAPPTGPPLDSTRLHRSNPSAADGGFDSTIRGVES